MIAIGDPKSMEALMGSDPWVGKNEKAGIDFNGGKCAAKCEVKHEENSHLRFTQRRISLFLKENQTRWRYGSKKKRDGDIDILLEEDCP